MNKTIDNSSAIETRPEKYDQLEQSGGLDVTIHGGSYTTQNTNIKVSQRSDGGGTTFVNKGGKVTRGADGSVVIDGGTTTISNANIDLSAIPSGTIIWTATRTPIPITSSSSTVARPSRPTARPRRPTRAAS